MKKILVTGASGYIGAQLITKLSKESVQIIGTDIVETKQSFANYRFVKADLRTNSVKDLILEHHPNLIIHLAAIVSPSKEMTREFIYDVEVNGTKKILDACIEANVEQIIVTSSGAAYGYYEDHPDWLTETDTIRGNEEFAYAYHKRVIEEMLVDYRIKHPQLKQLIFRVSTILGDHTKNDITNLFQKKNMLGLVGHKIPFVIIWDQDLLNILFKGAMENKEGIYNIAGDDIISLKEIAKIIGKRYIEIHPAIIKLALKIAKPLKLSRYGPEQVKFLQYRPVLANDKMKSEFGFIPQKSSKEAFLHYAKCNKLIR